MKAYQWLGESPVAFAKKTSLLHPVLYAPDGQLRVIYETGDIYLDVGDWLIIHECGVLEKAPDRQFRQKHICDMEGQNNAIVHLQ